MATTFIIGDYEYSIIEGEDHKVGATVIDTTKSSYGPLLKNSEYNGETYTLSNVDSTFYGCMNLIKAPNIPDSVVFMDATFQNCTSLIVAPKIPNSVSSMFGTFNGCTSLIQAPNIPNSVIGMQLTFNGCTNLAGSIIVYNNPDLEYASYIFANTTKNIEIIDCNNTASNTWKQIANNYSNISYKYVGYSIADINEPNHTIAFGRKVLYNEKNLVSFFWDTHLKKNLCIKEDKTLSSYIYNNGWRDVFEPNRKYLYIEALESATFSIVEDSDIISNNYEYYVNNMRPSFQYSYDSITWNNYTLNNQFNLKTGEKVYFKGDNLQNWVIEGFPSPIYFNINNGKCKAGGNIMSLRYLEPIGDEPIPCVEAFKNIFIQCESLIEAPELPATILTDNCYEDMFKLCLNLKTAPELPATTLTSYCYSGMFNNCLSLKEIPNLPSTTLNDYCYAFMFYNAIKANATSSGECIYSYIIPAGSSSTVNNPFHYMFSNIDGTQPFIPQTNTTFYVNVPTKD